MRLVIAGGSGFIGRHLADYYLAKGASVLIIGRSLPKIHARFGSQVEAVDWKRIHVDGKVMLSRADLVVNLTGAGIADQRWSNRRKALILKSRLESTQCLARVCAELGRRSPPLFNASAIGIYGLQPSRPGILPSALDEYSSLSHTAHDFSSEVVHQWEEATALAREAAVRVLHLRFAPVLGSSGGVLARMIPLFKLGLGGRVGSGHQPFSWVSIADVCRAIDFLFHHPSIDGPVNIVSPHTITQFEFAKHLAHFLHRPMCVRMPSIVIKGLWGQMGEELLLHGQHVHPTVLLRHGFTFCYPKIEQALQYVL